MGAVPQLPTSVWTKLPPTRGLETSHRKYAAATPQQLKQFPLSEDFAGFTKI
eukprot:CAMPEP_0194776030 /NCGR_PEP_ID=MMETSP0323_2-20130528/62004_1 /TAXON_ID=2866 ORGANISM="Crypthecodinium cohnii, Strain Seligo" /NCGR_SAMPLE_ID=MMETSP0323_2 /ASSEMBLY_ACC=CAM_ASM_000346 /LENGTH=51 /DNA_ID=CAMNT_0039712255 /DNA_START=134 /DNA_END=286 /DNA_ORIENTATION=+